LPCKSIYERYLELGMLRSLWRTVIRDNIETRFRTRILFEEWCMSSKGKSTNK